MNLTELRIGNYVKAGDKIEKITGVIQYGLYFNFGYFPNLKDWIKPIELTEEWLEKFGFITNRVLVTSMHLSLPGDREECRPFFYKHSKSVFTELLRSDDETEIVKFKYVHQLQNLYFCLTGEELTLNEKNKL